MILMVNIHYSRASDLIIADQLTTNPGMPISAYRDGFGNWCHRVLAPAGRVTLKGGGLVLGSSSTPYRRKHLIFNTLQF